MTSVTVSLCVLLFDTVTCIKWVVVLRVSHYETLQVNLKVRYDGCVTAMPSLLVLARCTWQQGDMTVNGTIMTTGRRSPPLTADASPSDGRFHLRVNSSGLLGFSSDGRNLKNRSTVRSTEFDRFEQPKGNQTQSFTL